MVKLFLISMIVAAIIVGISFNVIVKILEWRFLKKASSILLLAESIYGLIQGDITCDIPMHLSVRIGFSKSKIKFRNAQEACSKFEALLQKDFKKYNTIKFIMSMFDEGYMLEGSEIEECKEELENICHELMEMGNNKPKEHKEKP